MKLDLHLMIQYYKKSLINMKFPIFLFNFYTSSPYPSDNNYYNFSNIFYIIFRSSNSHLRLGIFDNK